MKEIQLTQGKIALVDDEDYDRLIAMGKWQCSLGYATKNVKFNSIHTTLRMHRVILTKYLNLDSCNPRLVQVDHINGNKLDNRKENLRTCSPSQNSQNRPASKNNTSGYKGVVWHSRSKKWVAKITANGANTHLGCFDDPKLAAKAYNEAAVKLYGEFANINQI